MKKVSIDDNIYCWIILIDISKYNILLAVPEKFCLLLCKLQAYDRPATRGPQDTLILRILINRHRS